MRNNLTPLRPALTAIAAVMALSATPAFAQDAYATPAQDTPVIGTPAPTATPAVEAAAAPVKSAVQSVATENVSAPTDAAMPATPMATQSTPIIHTADTSAAAAPIAKTAVPARHVAVASKASATPVAAKTIAPITAPGVAPLAPSTSASEPAPPAIAKTSTVSSTTTRNDNREIELAGAGALGLILIAGGAIAFGRRKRDEDGIVPATPATMGGDRADPVVHRGSVAYQPVEIAPAAIEGAPTTALHRDFDISRYGPYVQAAYRGPTEGNPSLSLRHRLKRARFMDQRARENGDTFADSEPMAATLRKPAPQSLIGTRLKDGLRSLRPQGGMRPAFG